MRQRIDEEHRPLTTGQAAKLAGLSIQTIDNLFDSGEIAGFRIPRSTHRRIHREPFRQWLIRIGARTAAIESLAPRTEARP